MIKVLFFGATADIVGMRELLLEVTGCSAADLREKLVADHPKLGSHTLLVSVNREYSSDGRQLASGDEVGIFTAVSGG